HRAKPAPDMLNEMKTLIGTDQGYYVGDQPDDAEAARAASLYPITLRRGDGKCDITSLLELEAFLEHREEHQ
ncbi:HAD family hydrolase, partial [Candidatus Bipolaricaulota bacterium]|nr:HAD family hydrolase [Candidatus Bipolaricaulota bacterium]